jgi:hypothetical protein
MKLLSSRVVRSPDHVFVTPVPMHLRPAATPSGDTATATAAASATSAAAPAFTAVAATGSAVAVAVGAGSPTSSAATGSGGQAMAASATGSPPKIGRLFAAPSAKGAFAPVLPSRWDSGLSLTAAQAELASNG